MGIAIVTGASSGMGREFVLQLNQYVTVDEIWVIARRQSALESLQDEVSVPVRPITLDLCDTNSYDTYAKLLEAGSHSARAADVTHIRREEPRSAGFSPRFLVPQLCAASYLPTCSEFSR